MNQYRTWVLIIIWRINNLHLMILTTINSKKVAVKTNKICLMSLRKWMFSNNHKINKQQLLMILMIIIHNNKQIRILISMILIIRIITCRITHKKMFLMTLIAKHHNKINKQYLIISIIIRVKVKSKTMHLMNLTRKIKLIKTKTYLETLKIKNKKIKIKTNKNKTCILKNNQVQMMIFYFE